MSRLMTAKIEVLSTGTGLCALTQKEGDGLTVTFEDGTVTEQFLSWKGLKQILGMRVGAAPTHLNRLPLNGTPA